MSNASPLFSVYSAGQQESTDWHQQSVKRVILFFYFFYLSLKQWVALIFTFCTTATAANREIETRNPQLQFSRSYIVEIRALSPKTEESERERESAAANGVNTVYGTNAFNRNTYLIQTSETLDAVASLVRITIWLPQRLELPMSMHPPTQGPPLNFAFYSSTRETFKFVCVCVCVTLVVSTGDFAVLLALSSNSLSLSCIVPSRVLNAIVELQQQYREREKKEIINFYWFNYGVSLCVWKWRRFEIALTTTILCDDDKKINGGGEICFCENLMCAIFILLI